MNYTLKKSLGQHFLKDENICRKIIDELKTCPCKNWIEVGSGGGALTKYIIELPDINFKAVEVDEEKVSFLKKKYPRLAENIFHQDFLELNKPFDEPFGIVGNFPYNISTQIIFKVLEWKDYVECLIGMFQKEVAQRISAKEGNKVYGVTSVLVQMFFDVIYLFDVNQNSFMPPPKVTSAVIKLLPKKQAIKIKDVASLTTLVKAAFGQRRKTLRNAVKQLFDEEFLKQDLFEKRAEQLSVAEFAELTFNMI
ncbi:MAG: ribosomal RNA small subunit methyltransferase A [Chitinophagaceae bacterium]|nr:ribosomal RNA small subunit methyltransferase A [Chitinophagaceae bacterium]